MQEVEVYLFLGFLESGKTTFIQDTLEDPRMEEGRNTLLLVCEDGEAEYAPEKFAVKNVAIETLDGIEELNEGCLTRLTKKYKAERVFVEFNGMWLLQQFFDAMPEQWVIVQMISFFESSTFLNYNANMRQLVFDKINMTQMTVFNRFDDSYDKEAIHKVVRAVSRQPEIIYEYKDGRAVYDDIVDPLPYDMNAPVVEIADRDFAYFYRDMNENADNYLGKTVKFRGMVASSPRLSTGMAVVGRHIMTCCQADIAYDGFAFDYRKANTGKLKSRDWVYITAKVGFGKCPVYENEGPILTAETIERTGEPDEIVATYY